MTRSRAYPVVPLEKAAELVSQVFEQLGHGSHDRDSLAQAWGYSKGQGLVARKVAALVQFGLLEREGASYSLSSLADQLLHPKSDEEQAAAKKTAFLSPTLFEELVAKYEPHGRIPGALPNILYREHGITRQVAEEAANIFVASGVYADAMTTDGQFRAAPRARAPEPTPDPEKAGTAPEPADRSPAPAPVTAALPVEQPGAQTFQLSLSGGQAVLRTPAQLTRQDLLKLRKLLELVALDVDEEA